MAPRNVPRPHNPIPESPYEVLALFTGAMAGSSLWIMSTGTLMPLFSSALGVGQTQLGWLLSIQLIGSVAMTSVAGMLTDRFGDRAVVFWSGVVMGGALLVAAFGQTFWWLFCCLLVYGVGYAAVTPAGSHAIIFFFRKADRGLAMGIRQCGVPIAGLFGSLILPAVALHFQYRGALAVAGFLTLTACWFASSLYREPQELRGERVAVGVMLEQMVAAARQWRLIFLALVSMILAGAQFAMLGFFTLTLVRLAHYSLPAAVALFTLTQFGAIVGRLSWGWVSDRIFGGSRSLPLGLNCILVAAVVLMVAGITPYTPAWMNAAFAFALGFTAEGWFGLSIIGFAEIGGEEHSGSALGVGITWALLAAFATPAIFGALSQTYGFPAAWRMLALWETMGIIPALLGSRALARAAVPASPS